MMARTTAPRAGFGTLFSAMAAAVQWRLLLLWLLLMLLPATVVALPLWRSLADLLDHSVHAEAWARHFDPVMFGDALFAMGGHVAWLSGAALLGLLLAVLLSPFLDGMVVGSGRAGRSLDFGALLLSGWIEYGRMFRVMLWSLLPYAVVVLAAGAASHAAGRHADQAVLEAQADAWQHGAQWVSLAVFVLMQAVVESTRAAFIADSGLRSATRAFGRGIRQLLRRPLKTLLFYLVVSLVGLAIAGVLGIVRIRTTAVDGGFWLALLLGQLIVLVLGWMRVARLFALARLAPSR
ncbi:hypothetical protein [Rhodanobacter sp. DHB23]|uniref:hypothetical protein n=1 Tax=Rhodanobacter sp. DHB23 TaxID=2775923 RepID=UPI001783F01E|nr:hypothetical protein [Rhodanobacter sp. DHB23]MBD8872009.1 hypothetical protein [Rhodanobacter sp. DHB23]